MKHPKFLKLATWTCLLLLATAGMAMAQVLSNNELEFTGTITEIMPNGDGGGTLFVDVDATDLRVLMNSRTEIRKGEDTLTMADLKKEDIIRVDGKFSSGGILASRVEVLPELPENGFSIRGHITDLPGSENPDTMLVALLGLTIEVPGDLKTEWEPVLKIGTNVQINGTISGQVWTATAIQLVSKERKHGMVRFEGEVTAIEGDTPNRKITVAVESTPPASQIVFENSETEVSGDIGIGSFVEVMGKLNPDYSITAREITVVGALEIKPDDRKIKIGQEVTFTVKLREVPTADVEVTLEETDPNGAITLGAASVTVPAGSRTADFTVRGDATGEATITARLESGGTATATVRVGNYSDEDNEQPGAALRIAFAPDHIKMGADDTRDVVLLVMPPQKAEIIIDLISTGGLVEPTVRRELSQGVAVYKVTIKSGSSTGPDSVTATLQGLPDVAPAELLVEVQGGKK